MNILVTGGAGYIGTHTLVELFNQGHTAVVVDNLSNSSPEAIRRTEIIVNQRIPFYKIDLKDTASLDEIFSSHHFDAVIHFAGLKSVGESVSNPIGYYANNINSTLALLQSMLKYKVSNIVFSSSATVYGTPESLPLTEKSRTGVGITNPYGQTKYMIEQILRDVANAHSDFSVTLLRYFNPIGAHKSGTIGEDPNGIPNNLLPYISQVAVGKLEKVRVFGGNYNTPDGTGVRDYIHVVDLAKGHIAALNNLKPGVYTYNLGTGRGTSVLELIKAFEVAAERSIPYQLVDRRPGDIAACYANPNLAKQELDWEAALSIEDACRDSWRWQSTNPNGY